MFTKVDSIVNGSYTVVEKQKMLEKLKGEINSYISDAFEQIKLGYKYCPECKQYYKEKAWETEVKHELREVCTFYSPCEFDDNTYEHKNCIIHIDICPMGHRIENGVHWN